MNRSIFLFLATLILTGPVVAQDTGSGLDFLNIGPSARILSISEASTAAQTGPSALYTNPSLLALEEHTSLDLSYTLWISNVNNQFAAANVRRDRFAYALGVYNSTSDGFAARQQPGPPAGEFSIGYLSLAGAAAYTLGPVAVGAAAQYLREEVFQFRANGYAVNAGVTVQFLQKKVRLAASVNNLGKMESLDEQSTVLPSTIKLGTGLSLVEFETPGTNDLPVLLTLYGDWSKPVEANPTSDYITDESEEGYTSLALDADVAELFYLQAGYRFGPTERPVSFGFGLAVDPIRVNYALVPFSTGFGTVHSFGLQYYFY